MYQWPPTHLQMTWMEIISITIRVSTGSSTAGSALKLKEKYVWIKVTTLCTTSQNQVTLVTLSVVSLEVSMSTAKMGQSTATMAKKKVSQLLAVNLLRDMWTISIRVSCPVDGTTKCSHSAHQLITRSVEYQAACQAVLI